MKLEDLLEKRGHAVQPPGETGFESWLQDGPARFDVEGSW